jgi:hypothetical protein
MLRARRGSPRGLLNSFNPECGKILLFSIVVTVEAYVPRCPEHQAGRVSPSPIRGLAFINFADENCGSSAIDIDLLKRKLSKARYSR